MNERKKEISMGSHIVLIYTFVIVLWLVVQF